MGRKHLLAIISSVIFLIAASLALFNFSFAQETAVKAGKKPFGGRILTTTVCNTGFWITVGNPKPGSFLIMPNTLQFGSKTYRPGAWVIGLALSPEPEKNSGSGSTGELAGENALGGGAGGTAATKKGNIPCIVKLVKIGEGEPVIMIGATR